MVPLHGVHTLLDQLSVMQHFGLRLAKTILGPDLLVWILKLRLVNTNAQPPLTQLVLPMATPKVITCLLARLFQGKPTRKILSSCPAGEKKPVPPVTGGVLAGNPFPLWFLDGF